MKNLILFTGMIECIFILFEDGYLPESEKVLQLMTNSSLSVKGVRLFTFGVGSDPNRHLISTLAR